MENNLAKISPTVLSLKKLREEGYTCWITEHWNNWSKTRQDLFGFIDIIALKKNETLAIQTTTATNLNARVKKISDSESVKYVRKAGWKILVWGTYKQNNRWQIKEVDVS